MEYNQLASSGQYITTFSPYISIGYTTASINLTKGVGEYMYTCIK